jgi:hypothetical protein
MEKYRQRMVLSIASTRQMDIKAKVKEARAHPCIYRVSGWSSVSLVLVTPSVGGVGSATISVMLIWGVLGW